VLDGAAAIVDAAINTYGRLDVLVNNAGISGGGEFASIAAEDFDRVFDTHFHGTVAVTRAAWHHLSASGAGRIVNISSASVFGGGGTSAYISAKAAIFGLTRALAPEAAQVGMRVNSIMPSAFTRMTNQIPDETFRTFLADNFPPEAVAPFVVWLAHADTDVNGETFSVGGGRAGRVFLGEAPGAAPAERTPEAWAENAEKVLAIDGFGIPASMMDEVLFEVAHLRESPSGAIASMDASDWSATARR
jgi:NAD(P)-dependent dehydrogenase (short-subunit alcohol dehydrogenase family)